MGQCGGIYSPSPSGWANSALCRRHLWPHCPPLSVGMEEQQEWGILGGQGVLGVWGLCCFIPAPQWGHQRGLGVGIRVVGSWQPNTRSALTQAVCGPGS